MLLICVDSTIIGIPMQLFLFGYIYEMTFFVLNFKCYIIKINISTFLFTVEKFCTICGFFFLTLIAQVSQ